MEEQRHIASPNHDIVQQLEETEVRIQQDDQQQQPSNRLWQRWRWHWQPSVVFQRFNITVTSFGSSDVRNDVWSCLIVLLTFWFFASMIVILGFYGSFNLQLGPYCSFLIEANPIFVHSIKAKQIDDQTGGPVLYGFHESPSLDVETTWSQNYTLSIEPAFHKDWTYYLNAGSRVDVSYDVKSPESASLFLVIARGKESLLQWIDTPSYPNSTMSWNMIYGSGKIAQDIKDTDAYFVAVGNLNLETVEVYLNITIKSVLYNISNAYFKCSLSNHVCSFKLILLKPNAAVLTSPGPTQVMTDENNWYIQVSYGPQWVTYFVGSCVVVALILAVFRYCGQSQPDIGDEGGQVSETVTNREPLLSPKNNDGSNWGSSYDSIPSDEDPNLEETIVDDSTEGKVLKDGEIHRHNTRRLCAICFDAPRDCFFLPCGHCAACFSCGSRIVEEPGSCPICRRKMKKVRKIFSV